MIFVRRNSGFLSLLAVLACGSALGQTPQTAAPTTDPSTGAPLPGVYKWADHGGQLHFDDKSLTEPRLTLDILDARRVPPARSSGVPEDFSAEVERRCAVARERAQNYGSATALYGRDPSGNEYRMSESQTALTLAALGRDQSRYCGPDAARKLYLAQIAKQQDRTQASR